MAKASPFRMPTASSPCASSSTASAASSREISRQRSPSETRYAGRVHYRRSASSHSRAIVRGAAVRVGVSVNTGGIIVREGYAAGRRIRVVPLHLVRRLYEDDL